MRSAITNPPSFPLILAACSLSLVSCGSATNRTLEEIFEQSYTIEPTANVTIRNGDGAIRVYGSNATEMRIRAVKRAYTLNRLKQIVVNVSARPGSVSVETSFPPKPNWGLFDRSGTVDYTIVIPQTAKISHLELGNGEVLVDGMHSQEAHARLDSGQMSGHNCFSTAVFSLGRGTLTLAYEWWEETKFSVQAEIAHGNTWIFLPSEAACHLIAETVHGRITNDFAEQRERTADEITNINTLIQGGSEVVLKLRATEGSIKIVEQNP